MLTGLKALGFIAMAIYAAVALINLKRVKGENAAEPVA
jgi:hypothetical protein